MTKIICSTFYKKCVILLESGVVLFLDKNWNEYSRNLSTLGRDTSWSQPCGFFSSTL